jgi:hypothetical protein
MSYRTYRLENRSPRYDKTVTAKISSYVKRLKHAVEDKFGGDEPIEIISFLPTFKEAADENDVGEGAAARLILYFLKDAAKEGYRAHMDETPSGMLQYPYMVQGWGKIRPVRIRIRIREYSANSNFENDWKIRRIRIRIPT